MNRFFSYFNFGGVVVLVVLCAIQWRANRQVHLEMIESEKLRLSEAVLIEKDAEAIKGYAADLDDFRQRLSLSEAELSDDQMKLAALASERDGLRKALEQWMAAVAVRDDAIKRVGKEIEQLAADRNKVVGQFNDLTAKYNTLVKQWNAEQGGH